MRKVINIDENGFYLRDILLEDSGNIPVNCIQSPIPTDIKGFYRPRWTGTEWVEGMPQAEIDALNNQMQPPTTEERLQAAEAAILAIMEVLG